MMYHFLLLRMVTVLTVVAFIASSVGPALASAPNASSPAAEMAATPPQTNPAGAPARAPKQEGGDPVQVARAYIATQANAWGLSPEDVAALEVSDVYTSKNNGVTHVYFVQRLNGLDIFNAITVVNVNANGSILSAGNRFVSDAANLVQDGQAAGQKSTDVTAQSADDGIISAEDAYRAAAGQLGLPADKPVIVTQEKGDVVAAQAASEGAAVPARLVYQLSEKGLLLLAWDLQIDDAANANFWSVRVDAASSEVLAVDNWVVHDNWGAPEHRGDRAPGLAEPRPLELPRQVSAQAPLSQPPGSSYLVYPMPVESPIHTAPLPPADGRVVVNDPADTTASPFGWHDTNGAVGAEFTTTRGNNVHAYTDRNNDGASDAGSEPDGGAGLVFTPTIDLTQQPLAYRHAAVVNLFYWNNIIHDVFYRYGFNEVSGNFQVNNYGNGGLGIDDVRAEAQDAADVGARNNANFFTPVDGSRPRMQMYLWNTASPELDGDLDSLIIAHEYGHGISNRLTGGPSNVSCLNNAEQAGEGWSDWFGLMLTMNAGDLATDGRGAAVYALNEPTSGPGIRPARYSTDMGVNNYTYGNIGSLVVPHGVGFLFATMLWEMTWGLVDEHGFDPDFYTGNGGNNIALQLVTDGLKIQPCGPGFVDSRNAILAADIADYGGANQCIIWNAFAKRGLGYSASQGSANSTTDGVAAFDLPPSCRFLGAEPPSQAICVGSAPTYTITAGVAYTAPVTLSASGQPAGASALFAVNPLLGPLAQSTDLTIGNTGGAAAGDYTITITGTDSTPVTKSVDVSLTVYSGVPGAPTLTSPANGAVGVIPSPTLVWSGVAQATGYIVEVDDDPGFGSINYSAPVAGTSHSVSGALTPATTYYWRVRATNLCGDGAASSTFSFTTLTLYCSTPNLAIPDNNPAGVFDTFSPGAVGGLTDLNLLLDVTHTWVGDLAMTLEHVPSGVTAIVVDRPGRVASGAGCNGNDMNIFLDDEASLSVETDCQTGSNPTPAYIDGAAYQPNNPLSAFDGLDLAGPWKLSVSDNAGADTGTLHQWCLAPVIASSQGKITIVKDSTPKSTQNFNFNAGPPTPLLGVGNEGGVLGGFMLDDAVPSDNDAYPKSRSFQLPNGTYTFGEAPPANWKLKAIECVTSGSSSVNVTLPNVSVTLGDEDVTCTFRNQLSATIQTLKYKDNNGNGVRNAGEPALAGWTITATLQPTGTALTPQVTNGLGRANFNFIMPGSYRVCEVLTGPWTNTQPGGGLRCYDLTLAPGQTASVQFGNRPAPNVSAAGGSQELTPLSPYPGVTITNAAPDAFDGYAIDWATWVDANLLTPAEEPVDAPDATTRMYLPVVVK